MKAVRQRTANTKNSIESLKRSRRTKIRLPTPHAGGGHDYITPQWKPSYRSYTHDATHYSVSDLTTVGAAPAPPSYSQISVLTTAARKKMGTWYISDRQRMYCCFIKMKNIPSDMRAVVITADTSFRRVSSGLRRPRTSPRPVLTSWRRAGPSVDMCTVSTRETTHSSNNFQARLSEPTPVPGNGYQVTDGTYA